MTQQNELIGAMRRMASRLVGRQRVNKTVAFVKRMQARLLGRPVALDDAPLPSGEPYAEAGFSERFPHKRVEKFRNDAGTYLLPADLEEDIVLRAIRRGQIFEREVVEAAKRYITPGSVVLDIGSNFGQMAVEFSKAAGPQGTVHCFEANDFVFELLKRNLLLNGADRAVAHFGAVWHTSGQELFFPDPDFKRFGSYGSYGVDPKARAGKRVETLAIDDLGIEGRVSFIKVDIQGSDIFAMRGARATILRDKPVLIFEFEAQFQKEFNTSFQDYQDFIREIGYEIVETVNDINFVIAPKT